MREKRKALPFKISIEGPVVCGSGSVDPAVWSHARWRSEGTGAWRIAGSLQPPLRDAGCHSLVHHHLQAQRDSERRQLLDTSTHGRTDRVS
jgi:hypothetical protein